MKKEFNLQDTITELKRMYEENGKLTTRMIDKNKSIYTTNYLFKKLNITSIVELYRICDIDVSEEKVRLSKRKPYTLEEIKVKFKEKGFELLTSELSEGVYTKVEYICSCGRTTSSKVCDVINKGTKCYECGKEDGAKKRKRSFEEINKIYEENGCILLSEYEEYHNSESLLKFKCKCGNIDLKSFVSFKLTPKCSKCNIVHNGNSHYCWKGGISPLHEYLRKTIYPWKIDSLKKYNYTCDISGKNNNLIIHHLYNFSDILKETLDIVKLPIYKNISAYTQEELELIKSTCLKLHYKYGLGICLTEDLHKEFHSIYGKRNNTLEQYLEFKNIKLKEEC